MRKIFRFARLVPGFVVFLLLLGGCSIKVRHEYDRKIDFSKYRHYTWLSKPVARNNPSLARATESAIEQQLAAGGYAPASPDEADFGIQYYGRAKGRVEVIDYDFSAWKEDYGDQELDIPAAEEVTLVIEIIDLKKRQLSWRGWAGILIKDKANLEAAVQTTVLKILKKFPPQK